METHDIINVINDEKIIFKKIIMIYKKYKEDFRTVIIMKFDCGP
jgi:hypothetical protein